MTILCKLLTVRLFAGRVYRHPVCSMHMSSQSSLVGGGAVRAQSTTNVEECVRIGNSGRWNKETALRFQVGRRSRSTNGHGRGYFRLERV